MIIKVADKGWVVETKGDYIRVFNDWDKLVTYLEDLLTEVVGVDHPTRVPRNILP